MTEQKNFEKVGVVLLASTGKSLKLEVYDPDRIFMDVYYISLNDLEKVLNKRQETATIVKVKPWECEG